MTTTEQINERVHALECMDYLASRMGNERLDVFWHMHGLPDGHTDGDLRDIATNDKSFEAVCSTFVFLMGSDEAIDGGFAI